MENMCYSTQDWAMRQEVGSGPAKWVLQVLSWHLNSQTGQCNPTVARISEVTELDRRTVMKALGHLEERGLVVKNKGHGRATQYAINRAVSDKYATEQVAQICNGVGDISSTEVVADMLPKHRKNIELNIEDKDIAPAKRSRAPTSKLSFEDVPEHMLTAVREFAEHRRNVKKPLTQGALDRFITAVHRTAEQVNMSEVDVINFAIDKGWQSINPEWIKNAQQNNGQSNFDDRKKREAEQWRDEVLYGSF